MPELKKHAEILGTEMDVTSHSYATFISSDRCVLSRVVVAGKIFHLREPLVAMLTRENGIFCLEVRTLSIMSFGHRVDEALRELCEDFAALWDAIAQAEDESLTGDAIAVKRKMLEIVSEVVPE
jgi:hypothetical protein